MRYLENHAKRVNMLPEAITFDLNVRFSICFRLCKLDIQSFLEKLRLAQSESRKIFKYASEGRPRKDRNY